MKKGLAIILSLTLILTSASAVYADETTGGSQTSSAESTLTSEAASDEAPAESGASEGPAAPGEETPDGTSAGAEAGTEEAADDNGSDETDTPSAISGGDRLHNAGELVSGGLYVIRSAAASQYVLDVQGGATEIRTNIQLHKYNDTNAEKWFVLTNRDGSYTFISASAGQAVDLADSYAADGSNLQIYTANFEASQRWILRDAGSGSYFICHAQSGLPVTIAGGYANGTNIALGSSYTDACRFTFEKLTPEDLSGTWLLQCAEDSALTAGITGGELRLTKKTGADTQRFSVSLQSNGYYTITALSDNRRLALDPSAKAGRGIRLVSGTTDDYQYWRLVRSEDGTVIIFSKAAPHVCLQISGALTEGSLFESGNFDKTAGQTLRFVDPDKGTFSGSFVVRSAKYPDRVLDIASGSLDDGANVQSYNNNWTEAQVYEFRKALKTDDTVYYIISRKSGKALACDGTPANDVNVIQTTLTGADNQKWVITGEADGTVSISPYSNTALALDIAGGSLDYRVNVRVHKANKTAAQKWYLSSNKITACELTGTTTLTVTAENQDTGVTGDDGKVYLFAVDPTTYTVGSRQPVASAAAGSTMTFTFKGFNKQAHVNEEYFTAILLNGVYRLNSNGMYITNPEAASTKTIARTQPLNKKGLAIYWSQDKVQEAINTLHVKNVAMNLPLVTLLQGSGASYNYNGKTYYFNSGVSTYYKDRIRELTAAGVQVTVVVYADSSILNAYSEYVTPTGRGGSSTATCYGMNAQETEPRDKLEAAFAFLAETFSDADAHVDNWVIGNELDDPVHWNYCGTGLALETYTTLYAQVYRLAYNTMMSIWGNVKVYDSLDHVWTTTSRGPQYYTAKGFTDSLNTVLSGEGAINWNMAFHPYCSPELDPRFWNGAVYGLTHDGSTTPTISMYNIDALTTYVANKFGSDHAIILSETGINAYINGVSAENEQAAAIAYAYYIAEYTAGVDNLIIHCYQDTAGEAAGGWHLGLKRADGSIRLAYNVMAFMDSTRQGLTWTQNSKQGGATLVSRINNAKAWTDLIPGFDINTFGDSRY